MTPERDQIEAVASDWLIRRQSGLSAAERTQLELWLGEDPAHAEEFSSLERAWTVLNEPQRAGAGSLVNHGLMTRSRWRRRRRSIAAASTAGLAFILGFVAWHSTPAPRVATSSTPAIVAKPDRRPLPDGSTVDLNSGAEIAVDFSDRQRTVDLKRGEALFDVAKDVTRPFVVRVDSVEVRAIGTAFSVRRENDDVHVLVTSGVVAVKRPGLEASAVRKQEEESRITAGQEIRIPQRGVEAPAVQARTPAAVADAIGWRTKRVLFSGVPLAEVVKLFNRENALQLRVDDPKLAAHELTGIFWSNDAAGLVRLLEAGMNVEGFEKDGNVWLRYRKTGTGGVQ